MQLAADTFDEWLAGKDMAQLRLVADLLRHASSVEEENIDAAFGYRVEIAGKCLDRRVAATVDGEQIRCFRAAARNRIGRAESSAHCGPHLAQRLGAESLPQSHRLRPATSVPESIEHQDAGHALIGQGRSQRIHGTGADSEDREPPHAARRLHEIHGSANIERCLLEIRRAACGWLAVAEPGKVET